MNMGTNVSRRGFHLLVWFLASRLGIREGQPKDLPAAPLGPTSCPAARLPDLSLLISGKPFSDSGRGSGGVKGSLLLSRGFGGFHCKTHIPLCSQELLGPRLLGERLTVNLVHVFLIRNGSLFFYRYYCVMNGACRC